MNVLAYSTQDPEKVASYLVEKLREELGPQVQAPHTVEQVAGTGASLGSVLKGFASVVVGGKEDLMYVLTFDVQGASRPFQLQAHVNRQGIGCHVGALLYSAPLAKPVDSEVTFGGSRGFTGGAAAAKLNASADLVKRFDHLVRTTGSIGGFDLTIGHHCALTPVDQGTVLTLATLGRAYMLGFKLAIDSKEFVDLAAAAEALL